eukprot:100168-Rhodomonas_salina.1
MPSVYHMHWWAQRWWLRKRSPTSTKAITVLQSWHTPKSLPTFQVGPRDHHDAPVRGSPRHAWAKAHFAGAAAREWLRLIAIGSGRKKELELGFQKSAITSRLGSNRKTRY